MSRKNNLAVVKAVARLADFGYDIAYLIAGHWAEWSILNMARQPGIAGRVRVLGEACNENLAALCRSADAVLHDWTGLTVGGRCVDAIITSLRQLFDNEETIAAMGRAAKKNAAEESDWPIVAKMPAKHVRSRLPPMSW